MPEKRTVKQAKTLGRRKGAARAAPPPKASKSPPKRPAPKARQAEPESARAKEPAELPPFDADVEWDKAKEKFAETAERASAAADKAGEVVKKLGVDLSRGFDDAFGTVRAEARDLLKRGQHTRARIKFRGKQLAEIPVAALAAAEVATLWWAGPLRLLIAHVVGHSVLEVEFISDAEAHVAAGRAFLADGDVDKAVAEFDRAIVMNKRSAPAHLGRGIALKLRGDKAGARASFLRAEELAPASEPGREARRHLDNLGS